MECWATIQQGLLSLADPLPPELSFGESGQPATARADAPVVSVEDYDRIARCMEVDAVRWLEAAEKGQAGGVIHWKVAGICRTLAGYAAGGWTRKPSAKQARHGLDALGKVQESGVLSSATAGDD